MKLLHISDLHLGKKLHDFSLLEDQRHILHRLLRIAAEEKADGVLVAGDIYDKTIPPVEAVALWDDFLTELSGLGICVLAISGNHDSPERLQYGSRIMQGQRVHIAGEYRGTLPSVTLHDAHGPCHVHLMPYLRPSTVNRHLDAKTASFQDCVAAALAAGSLNPAERNILVAHQFVTCGGQPPEASDSETKSLGGTDEVDAALFDAFDYVALGHIHKPQRMGRDTLRYSGSPLKFSFSESRYAKSATLVTLGEKGSVSIALLPLCPLRDLKQWKGTLAELQTRKCYDAASQDSYMHITLTDDAPILDAIGKVRVIYPRVMLLDFEGSPTSGGAQAAALTSRDVREKTPLALFSGFFEMQNGRPMSASECEAFAVAAGEEEGWRA